MLRAFLMFYILIVLGLIRYAATSAVIEVESSSEEYVCVVYLRLSADVVQRNLEAIADDDRYYTVHFLYHRFLTAKTSQHVP
jgi:hypothetical protein